MALPQPAKLRRFLLPIAASVLIFVALAAAAALIRRSLPDHVPDFIVYWLGGRFLTNGNSPYDMALFQQEVGVATWRFFYPLPLAVISIPLGRLPFELAYTLWMAASMAFILAAILLLLSTWRFPKPLVYLFPILAGAMIFRPAMVLVRNGQLGGLFLLLLAFAAAAWERKRWGLGGAAVGLLMLKPSIGAPILGFLALYLLVRRKWRGLVAIAGVEIFLFLLGIAFDPQWVQRFLANSNQKMIESAGSTPTVLGAAQYACGERLECVLPIAGMVFLALIAGGVYLLIRMRSRVSLVVALVTCVGLLITPFGYAYEQVLLIAPIVIGLGVMAASGKPFLLTGMAPLAFSVIALALFGWATVLGRDIPGVILSAMCLGFTVWAMVRERDEQYRLTSSLREKDASLL